MSESEIDRAWQRFVDSCSRLTAGSSGATDAAPAALSVSMPIDWPAFYEFVVFVHEKQEKVAFEEVERRLVEIGLSEGEAEDVAGAYWIGLEVLDAYELVRGAR